MSNFETLAQVVKVFIETTSDSHKGFCLALMKINAIHIW